MKFTHSTTLLLGLVSILLMACGGGDAGASSTPAVAGVATAVEVSAPVSDARQMEIEDQIVSTFENSTPVIQYAFIANINDGRGYTAGRAGFTTGTGDLLQVVVAYTALVPGNVLATYIAALQQVNGTSSVAGLGGMVLAWQTAAKDARFLAVQDRVNDSLYRQPARQLTASLAATLPLTKLALYEAGIQHGFGTDYDSVNKIAERATAAVGGAPRTGGDEKKWLQAFLSERRLNLLSPANQATAAGWAASVSRAEAIQSIYDKANFNLAKTITYTVYGDSFTI